MTGEEVINNAEQTIDKEVVENENPTNAKEIAPPEEPSSKELQPEEKPEVSVEEISQETDKNKDINFAEVTEAGQAKELLQDKGFDYGKLQEEYNQNGDISKETREALAKSGITDDIIDNYVEGQKAKAEKEIDAISSDIGGKEGFRTVIDWAGKNLDPAEIESINAVRDKNVMKIILKDLKTRMDEKEGITPEYTKGDGGKANAMVFESKAQMMAAIKDPRYKKDEAYRLQTRNKISASREAGIDLGI